MRRINFIAGQKINNITFINDLENVVFKTTTQRVAMFECYCGNRFSAVIELVKSGNTKSCGCYGIQKRKERFTKHGLRDSPIYTTWIAMKARCCNKARVDYKYYGGRGIIVSEDFLEFEKYYSYVTSLPNFENKEKFNLTIDRINNNGNYEKGNLRWATKKEQSLNQQRNTKST